MTAIDRLRADESLRREGATLVVDALLEQRVADLVDLTGLLELAAVALVRAPLERAVSDHVLPGFDRLRGEVKTRETRVGDLLPAEAADALERSLVQTRFPRFEWARDAVDPKLLERLFAPILQDLLLQFVGKLPGAGAFSALARVGGKAAGGVASGAKAIAGEFSKTALATLRDAFSARLASDEGRALVEQIRSEAFRHCLEVPLDAVLADFDAMPWRDAARVVPQIVEHDLRSALGHAVLRTELAAFLAIEGERTLLDVLDEAGALPNVRAYLRVRAEGLLATLVESPAFEAWLARLG